MLRQVRLQNFKSFQDATINLGLRNFLVGPNMSGKSNFIHLFEFLQHVAFSKPGVWGLANAFTGGFFEWTWKGGDSNLIKIGLDGTTPHPLVEGATWNYELAIVGDDRGSIRVQDERLSVYLDGRSTELSRVDESSYGLIVEGIYDESVFPEFVRKIVPRDLTIVVRACGGVSKLMMRLPGYLTDLEHAWYGRPVAKAIVIRDWRDPDLTSAEQAMSQKIQGRHFSFPHGIQFCAVRQEMETWLLADGKAINAVAQRAVDASRLKPKDNWKKSAIRKRR